MTIQKSEPIACDLAVFTPEERERHVGEGRALQKAALGFMKLDDKVEVYFKSDIAPEPLRAWAANERRCCAFLTGAHVRREEQRVVLTLEAPGDGARIWSDLFLSAPGGAEPAAPRNSNGDFARKGGLWAGIIAAGVSLACVLPIVGAYLVGRGFMPAAWNIGEGTYLMLGAGALLGYVGWKARKRFSKRADASDCGC